MATIATVGLADGPDAPAKVGRVYDTGAPVIPVERCEHGREQRSEPGPREESRCDSRQRSRILSQGSLGRIEECENSARKEGRHPPLWAASGRVPDGPDTVQGYL